MSKGSYGTSMGITRVGYDRRYVRTFGNKQAHRFVCNRCRNPFKQGEKGKQTTYNAWKHYPKCPGGGA